MTARARQRGITLQEMVIVVACMAVFVGIAMPAMRKFFDALASSGPAKPMISAALATARAIAVKEQRYAGIRFQMAAKPDPNLPLVCDQYMTYIIQDPELGAWFFRAVDNTHPMKLPTQIAVMDLIVVPGENRNITNPYNPLVHNSNFIVPQVYVDGSDPLVTIDSFLTAQGNGTLPAADNFMQVRDMTTFSIIFSPAGKLVVTGVRVVNRGDHLNAEFGALSDTDTQVNDNSRFSLDDIFNIMAQVDPPRNIGMFYQDCYWKGQYNLYQNFDLGLGPEPSRTSFLIIEKDKFKTAYDNAQAWTQYLQFVAPNRIHLNPYTGTMIGAD